MGDRVSIQSEDRPEWVILDLATVAVRGITVGFYPTNPAAEVEYLLTDWQVVTGSLLPNCVFGTCRGYVPPVGRHSFDSKRFKD